MIYFGVTVKGVSYVSNFTFFTWGRPIVPAPFIENTSLFPFINNYLCSFFQRLVDCIYLGPFLFVLFHKSIYHFFFWPIFIFLSTYYGFMASLKVSSQSFTCSSILFLASVLCWRVLVSCVSVYTFGFIC